MSKIEYSKENFDFVINELNRLIHEQDGSEISKEDIKDILKEVEIMGLNDFSCIEDDKVIDHSLTEEEEEEIYETVKDRMEDNNPELIELNLDLPAEKIFKLLKTKGKENND